MEAREVMTEGQLKAAVEEAERIAKAQPRASAAYCAEQGVRTAFAARLLDWRGDMKDSEIPLFHRLVNIVEARLQTPR